MESVEEERRAVPVLGEPIVFPPRSIVELGCCAIPISNLELMGIASCRMRAGGPATGSRGNAFSTRRLFAIISADFDDVWLHNIPSLFNLRRYTARLDNMNNNGKNPASTMVFRYAWVASFTYELELFCWT
jgi:hypothetical protein